MLNSALVRMLNSALVRMLNSALVRHHKRRLKSRVNHNIIQLVCACLAETPSRPFDASPAAQVFAFTLGICPNAYIASSPLSTFDLIGAPQGKLKNDNLTFITFKLAKLINYFKTLDDGWDERYTQRAIRHLSQPTQPHPKLDKLLSYGMTQRCPYFFPRMGARYDKSMWVSGWIRFCKPRTVFGQDTL
ncbi:hypothetical protein Bpfe_008535 [Biomphalaria pfeifferi]|uniref:Uncharacterized protein n=1 Tax=Biomphalaria pfeifferi TaxID=112525 RepID=A0AAD8FEJ9_BIOPF|nr:hypothetical protein Bpfe_008535 [Biomphalaria pfeifferi]